jgi:hypothetical protein
MNNNNNNELLFDDAAANFGRNKLIIIDLGKIRKNLLLTSSLIHYNQICIYEKAED